MIQGRFIHHLKLRIPIPNSILQQEKQIKELESKIKKTCLDLKEPKFSDDDVYESISKITKIPNTFNKDNTNSKEEFNPNKVQLMESIYRAKTVDDKINILSDYLSNQLNSTFLPDKFINSKKLIPYEKLCDNEFDNNSRLSVTKILPNSFCELRKMYRLYLEESAIETPAMINGRKIHKVLEDRVHPQTDIYLKTKYGAKELLQIDKQQELNIPQHISSIINEPALTNGILTTIDISDDIYISVQLQKISQTINRIINIFKFGKGREILVHALYNKKTNKILTNLPESGIIDKDHIIISGIIDDIYLTSDYDDAFKAFQEELGTEINKQYDFESTFKVIKSKMTQWTDLNDPMLYLVINDDKSIMRRFKPSISNQKNQLLQVGIYRYLLGILSKDINFSYESWRFNMISRREKIDEPLHNSIVSLTCLINQYLLKDYIKLKNGDPINYDGIKNPPSNTYNSSAAPYIFQNTTNIESLNILNGEWKNPPTFSHIIARLAQVENLLKTFLSNKLEITYIDRLNGELINSIYGKFNEKYVNDQINLGMDLWLGKREPFPPSNENICKKCEFNRKCKIPNYKLL